MDTFSQEARPTTTSSSIIISSSLTPINSMGRWWDTVADRVCLQWIWMDEEEEEEGREDTEHLPWGKEIS